MVLAPPPTLAVDSTTLASAKVLFFTNTSLVESSFDHTTSHTMTFTARDRVWTNLRGLATSRPRGRLTARDEP